MSELQKLKERAQFFKRGHVIPRRMLSVNPKRFQHHLTFGRDTWALPGAQGYVLFGHSSDGGSWVHITGKLPWIHCEASRYHKTEKIYMIGDKGTPNQFVKDVLDALGRT